MEILDFAIRNGVSGILLIILIALSKHHLDTIKVHQKEKAEYHDEKAKLEKALREKIEELLTDQLEAQKPLTEALLEYNRLIGYFKDLVSELEFKQKHGKEQ